MDPVKFLSVAIWNLFSINIASHLAREASDEPRLVLVYRLQFFKLRTLSIPSYSFPYC